LFLPTHRWGNEGSSTAPSPDRRRPGRAAARLRGATKS
jgi:hypothetical protein